MFPTFWSFLSLLLLTNLLPGQWVNASANSTPTRYVGKMVAFYRDGSIRVASGVLVGPRHVLTAGHALFQKNLKWQGRPSSEWSPVTIMFTPGQQGSAAPFGSANATSWSISATFLAGTDQTRDVGIMRLNRALAANTGGYASIGLWNNSWTYDVTVYGYPASSEWPKKQSFAAMNDLRSYSPWNSWHEWWSVANLTGLGGVSGGPAMTGNTVLGVFCGQTGAGWLLPYLRGFRMTPTPRSEILAWIANRP